MSDEEKQPEQKGQGFGGVLRNVVERVGETLDVTAKTTRLSLDVGALNARRNGFFQEMGRKVYELYGKGLVKNTALLGMCAEVAAIDAQIAEKRAHIAELRGQQHTEEPTAPPEEMGVESEPEGGAPPTSGQDLSDEEERQVRPPGDRRL
ncbi:MAG: hypothetical protein HY321_10130 [Armatimonadetes bacterium]|nr:hypothetical protein [Armatimonadota bacterium]